MERGKPNKQESTVGHYWDWQGATEEAGSLVEAVLGLLGLEDKDVSNSDTLEGLGVDSMQLAEIRARLQRALCRPVPIEEVRLFWQGPSDLAGFGPVALHVAVLHMLLCVWCCMVGWHAASEDCRSCSHVGSRPVDTGQGAAVTSQLHTHCSGSTSTVQRALCILLALNSIPFDSPILSDSNPIP